MSRLALFLVLVFTTLTTATDYFERLNLTPLPLGSILASFEFRSNESQSAYESQNFRYFPRSLGQTLQHAHAKELHIRFTTGRWDAETWGARPWDGVKEGGTGVELWAWIEADSKDSAYEKWHTLTQALSGLFCASLNFIDSTRTTRPILSFSPQGDHNAENENLHLLHGVLPGEVVCTENLTPFLKLLPCKGKAGISSLLDGHKVFDASWQSMSIDVRPKCHSGQECLVEIQQTIDVVLNIERSKRPRDNPIPRPVPEDQLKCDETKTYNSQDTCYPRDLAGEPAWSLKEIFGRPVAGMCPLTGDEGPEAKSICINTPHSHLYFIGPSGFEVKSETGPERRCYQIMQLEPFDIDALESPHTPGLYSGKELLSAERTITGQGAAAGNMRTVFTNPSQIETVKFVYFESLPWFLRPYMHTLKTELKTGGVVVSREVVKEMYYKPAIDRKRGTQLEVVMEVPPASTVMMTYDFEKAILRYTEYPPDANRGFNVAPAVIRILGKTNLDGTPRDIYIRTTSLLAALPTPDFSMPYNVIILTSTVMALAFGSIFNLLVRRFVALDEVPPGRLPAVVQRLRGRIVALRDRMRGKEVKKE